MARKSCARVKFLVNSAESALIDVGVDLRSSDVGMAQHFLNDAKIGAMIQQVSGKAMAELMGMDFLGQACCCGALVDNLFNTRTCEPSAPPGEEQKALGLGLYQRRAGVSEVGSNGVASGVPDRGESGFRAFAGDADPAFFEAEAFNASSREFRQSQPAGVKEFENSAVAARQGVVCPDGFEQLPDLLFVESFRERKFLAGRLDGFSGITNTKSAGGEPSEKDLHGDEFHTGTGGGESVFFALGKMIGEVDGCDSCRGFELMANFKPIGKGLEDAAHEQLVIDGQTALGGKVEDEGVDG